MKNLLNSPDTLIHKKLQISMNLRHNIVMNVTATAPMTLREMRDAKGLTSHAAAEGLASILGRNTYDFSSILKAEAGGIFDARVLNAYSVLYGQPLEAVMNAVGIVVEHL